MIKNFFKQIVVKILEWEAKTILKKYKPKIVAVTGSVGKTSVKEAIHAVMSAKYRVRKSDKSYNSELGIPLTIINRPTAWNSISGWLENILEGLALIIFPNQYPEWLVLEVGADRPGDIRKVCKWLKPDVAVITRLPDVPVHIEFFSSKEEVIEEKMALAKAISTKGVVVMNIDDDNIRAFKEDLSAPVLTYGLGEEATVRATDAHVMYHEKDNKFPDGMAYKLNYKGKSVPVRVRGALGKHHIYTTLAACAVGVSQGLNEVDIVEAISEFVTPPGRMRIIPGIKDTVIIDDTYNSSPAALEAGLETLDQISSLGRKIVALGDMLELGEHTIEAHKSVGQFLADKVDLLILVGLRSKFIAEGAIEAGFREDNILHFDNSLEAGKYLQNELGAGDIVYAKGSQSMRMEKLVEEIMLEPDQKEKLLCRQEEEWLASA